MALVKPFKAIRPTKDKVSFVASRSYEEYSKDELKSVLKYNPLSFLHIINPGFKFDKNISGKERFRLVHNRYLEFLEEHIFQKDEQACFYLYQIEKDDFTSLGFFCACSVMDYRTDVIKKHEDTIQHRERIFADYLHAVGFNAEPVLMTYEDDDQVHRIFQNEIQHPPEFDFSTPDRVNHKMWKISDPKTIGQIESLFDQKEALYIADGHHRSASSNLLAKKMEQQSKAHTHNDSYNFFMAYLIPESHIKIHGFNRMIKDLNGLTAKEFLIKLDGYFRIEKQENGFRRPLKKHHFCMYLDGEFYSLHLRRTNYTFTDALSRLDTQILCKTILEPILGITDLRNDQRISYGHGKGSPIAMKECVDEGEFAVGFSMAPITMEEIKAIADAGLVMPPKSTYIEPKLRSGLAIYEF
ncbi:DUF1015 domain-containing protein [Flagellimonas olearia]|uniref:DUF1015 domain-containing protein n=1 Tax=Flagellimonas olearia TaxID=552546 RepID=A0A444VQ00_9FLAO|nr:DUF1015 domain-containing protein [Allomuricauda olearia]RYC52884.1 hypothetical protein DN53_01295 [Allomuricauda olearia]